MVWSRGTHVAFIDHVQRRDKDHLSTSMVGVCSRSPRWKRMESCCKQQARDPISVGSFNCLTSAGNATGCRLSNKIFHVTAVLWLQRVAERAEGCFLLTGLKGKNYQRTWRWGVVKESKTMKWEFEIGKIGHFANLVRKSILPHGKS